MLSAFGKAFKTPDLRKKIFFTLAIMGLFRFGSPHSNTWCFVHKHPDMFKASKQRWPLWSR